MVVSAGDSGATAHPAGSSIAALLGRGHLRHLYRFDHLGRGGLGVGGRSGFSVGQDGQGRGVAGRPLLRGRIVGQLLIQNGFFGQLLVEHRRFFGQLLVEHGFFGQLLVEHGFFGQHCRDHAVLGGDLVLGRTAFPTQERRNVAAGRHDADDIPAVGRCLVQLGHEGRGIVGRHAHRAVLEHEAAQ